MALLARRPRLARIKMEGTGWKWRRRGATRTREIRRIVVREKNTFFEYFLARIKAGKC